MRRRSRCLVSADNTDSEPTACFPVDLIVQSRTQIDAKIRVRNRLAKGDDLERRRIYNLARSQR